MKESRSTTGWRVFTWRYFTLHEPNKTLGLCYLDGKPYSRVFPGAALIATEAEAKVEAAKLAAVFQAEELP
jgi:cation diffusion facilitator CzcD-associated flavoprotein CzcO